MSTNSARTKMRLLLVVLGFCALNLRLSAQTWMPQVSGTYAHFASVQFVDEHTGWVCGSAGKVIKTIDGGANWFQPGSTLGVDLSALCFVDANTGWVAGLGGVISKTTDGGVSWTLQSVGTTGWLNCIQFLDSQTGWAAGLYGTILKTTNSGATWTSQVSGTASTIEQLCVASATKAWMVTSDGGILSTENGGTTWTLQTTSPPTTLNSICSLNATVGWVAGGAGKISKTTDGGATWTDQASGTTQQLNDIAFVDADTGWAAGNGGTIRMTTNGGATWTSQNSLTTENLQSIDFQNSGHGYAVGLSNTILEYATAHAVPIQLASFVGIVLNENTVQLDWRTISEVNNYGFFVERATGSPENFVALNTNVIHGNGTTNEPRRYSFTDNNAAAGRLYYRLRQIDLDGAVTYSEPITVDVLTEVGEHALPAAFALKQNYPNPFNPSTKIEFSIATASVVSLKVYDMLGREVTTIQSGVMNPGNYVRTFSGEGLSSGVYMYKLSAGGFTKTMRFVLAK